MKNVNQKNNNQRIPISGLITLIVILAVGLSYFIWKDITEETCNNKTKEKSTNNYIKELTTHMSIQWFEDYLTPFFKVNGQNYLNNPTDRELFSVGMNLTVCLMNGTFEKKADKYLIKKGDVSKYIEKYYGIENFIYNVNDNQFQYNETEGGYLSTLAFGVGCPSEGPIAKYTVSNVVYDDNDVTLNVLEDYNGDTSSKEYNVRLICNDENCSVKNVVLTGVI